jgi:hypothetical protein
MKRDKSRTEPAGQSDPRENNLRAWRRVLKNDPLMANRAISVVLMRLQQSGLFHHTDLARFNAHMRNGVTCPGEYGVSEHNGCVKVACS